MSTTIGKTVTEGIFDHSIEVYTGVEHVVLFVQNANDRDGIGTKILLSENKLNELMNALDVARAIKGWSRNED
jgi:hypothetical protein